MQCTTTMELMDHHHGSRQTNSVLNELRSVGLARTCLVIPGLVTVYYKCTTEGQLLQQQSYMVRSHMHTTRCRGGKSLKRKHEKIYNKNFVSSSNDYYFKVQVLAFRLLQNCERIEWNGTRMVPRNGTECTTDRGECVGVRLSK